MSQRATRRSRATILVVLSLLLLALLVVPFSSALASSSAADATNGQALFQQKCASCHGTDASGGKKVGSATAPDIRWSAIGGDFKTADLVQRAILQGKDETGANLDPAMPRFGSLNPPLSDSDAADIVAYLQTLTSGLPKTGEPIDGTMLPWLLLAGMVLALSGIRLRQAVR